MLSNCSCTEHLNCVMSLKLGFVNQVNMLVVLAFVLLVLLGFDLVTSHQLHSAWDVFVARAERKAQAMAAESGV